MDTRVVTTVIKQHIKQKAVPTADKIFLSPLPHLFSQITNTATTNNTIKYKIKHSKINHKNMNIVQYNSKYIKSNTTKYQQAETNKKLS